MLKKIHSFLERLNIPNWLGILLFVCLILRIPSFFEPYYYGDEMIYLTLGQGIRQGVPLYSGVYDNKPPVIYLIAALAENEVVFKILLAIASLISICFFAKIAKHIFENKPKTQKIAVFLFAALSTLPLLEGNIANAENFMLAFSLPAIYILLTKSLNIKNLILSGFLLGLSFHTKIPAILDFPIIIIFWIIIGGLNKSTIFNTTRKTFYLALGLLIPVIISIVCYGLSGNLGDYFKSILTQNVGYVSSWRGLGNEQGFLIKNAPLIIRFLMAFAGIALTYVFRKKLSKAFILASVWLMLSLFAATISERPYPHYLLQSTPAISVFLGILLGYKTVEQSLVAIPLLVAFFVPVYYKFWYYPTTSYYVRFLKYASGLSDKKEYVSGFNKYVPRNYEIADFLVNSSYPKNKVFIWGPDSSAIYALSRRLPPIKYVADYHVFDYSDKTQVVKMLSDNMPRFIIITPEAKPFNEIANLLRKNYLLVNQIENAEIWSLITVQK